MAFPTGRRLDLAQQGPGEVVLLFPVIVWRLQSERLVVSTRKDGKGKDVGFDYRRKSYFAALGLSFCGWWVQFRSAPSMA
jgi:hypothetical protein